MRFILKIHLQTYITGFYSYDWVSQTNNGVLMWTGVVDVMIADQVDAHFAHLAVTGVPVPPTRQWAVRAGSRRRSLVQYPTQFTLERVRHVRLDVDREPIDAVDSFLQLVGLGSLVRWSLWQTLGAERTQQQRQKQVQHLHNSSSLLVWSAH